MVDQYEDGYMHSAKSVLFSAPSRFRESPLTLTGKVGARLLTLTNIEEIWVIGVVNDKSQFFNVTSYAFGFWLFSCET